MKPVIHPLITWALALLGTLALALALGVAVAGCASAPPQVTEVHHHHYAAPVPPSPPATESPEFGSDDPIEGIDPETGEAEDVATYYDVLEFFIMEGGGLRNSCEDTGGDYVPRDSEGDAFCNAAAGLFGIRSGRGGIHYAAVVVKFEDANVIATELVSQFGREGWHETERGGMWRRTREGRLLIFEGSSEKGLAMLKLYSLNGERVYYPAGATSNVSGRGGAL